MTRWLFAAAFALLLVNAPAARADLMAMPGWVVHKTQHSYGDLVDRLEPGGQGQQMGVVSRASATVGAKKVLKQDIPGNMVVGVYHPRYAVRLLEASIPAGIEAPIRFYITENDDGTASLSYKIPSSVFAPYADGGQALKDLAAELDTVFDAIAQQAAGN